MGSKDFNGVKFAFYVNDHRPPHVHAITEGSQVIVALLPGGEVDLADRWDAVTPSNTKRSTIAKVLRTAADNVDELIALWEGIHGSR